MCRQTPAARCSLACPLVWPAAEAEVTYGDKPHGRLELQAPKQEVLEMEALGATGGGAEPQQVRCISSWEKLGAVSRHAETEFE